MNIQGVHRVLSNRRVFLKTFGALMTTTGFANAAPADDWRERFAAEMKMIEANSAGRLGVVVLDTANGARFGYRENERFPICSTFKLLAAGAVLAKVDRGEEILKRRMRFMPEDIVANSPTTQKHVGGDGMTLAEICEAALTLSDNTAGNLLLETLGGPAGLTAFARSMGDGVTRLDRNETSLNEALPGDERDTTSPDAMAADIQKLTLGTVLSEKSRAQLLTWMKANQTSAKRFRAVTPDGWIVADKTGSGERGATIDAGLIWPPGRPPIILTAYLRDTTKSPDECSAAIAAVARVVVTRFAG